MRLSDHSRPISVCFVIDRLSRAGTETQLLALIRKLNRDVVHPTLCLLNGSDSESLALRPLDCPVLDLQLQKIASAKAFTAASRMVSFWRSHRVEVVQTYFLDSTYFAAPLARLCGIPHTIRVRNNVGYWMSPRHRLFGRLSARVTKTLTNSEDGRRAVTAVDRLRAEQITVIENGVDLERFPPCPPPNTGRPNARIGLVANLRPVKNVDGLIRAAAILRDHFPQLLFSVAGDGPERSRLEKQTSEVGLDRQFRFHGAVSDVPAFLSQIDVAVLCSHSESMSNALLEYMAAGRAIVATNVGANARLVRHEQEGLIVAPGDDVALATGIRVFLENADLARLCAEAARSRVEESFSRARMIRRFEEFYSSIARRKNPRRNAV